MRMFGSERIASLMDKMGYKEGEVIQHISAVNEAAAQLRDELARLASS